MAAIELGTGYITLTVSTKDMSRDISRAFGSAEGTAAKSGKAMGSAMAKGFATSKPDIDGLTAEVERAQARITQQAEISGRKQEAAKRKVEIAQARLNEATKRYGGDSSQALTAVDRLATAEQKLESETLAASSAQGKLQAELSQSKTALDNATKASANASKTYAKGWKGVGQRIKATLGRGVKAATDDAEKRANKGGQGAGSKFGNAFKSAMGPIMATVSVAAVGTLVKDSIVGAGQLQQSIGAVDAVFKGNSDAMHRWAAEAASTIGLSKNEYNELGSVIGSQLKNAGTSMDELAPKTKSIIDQGADMAAQFGGTTKEAVEAMSAAFRGERDPIERYGVSLNQSAIEAEASALGFEKVGKTLSAEANQAATMSLIMKQTADSHGAAAREVDTYAAKQEQARASAQNLRDAIGTKLLPVATMFMDYIIKSGLPAIQNLANGFGEVVGWVKENANWLGPLAAAIVGAVAGYQAYRLILLGVTKATAAYNIVQKILNGTLKANPIGLVITLIGGLVAAIIWLYKNNETARKIIDAVWLAIKTGIKSAVDWIIGAWNNVKTWLTKTLPDAFNALRDKNKAVWNGIWQKIRDVWTGVKSTFNTIKNYLKDTLGGAFQNLRNKVTDVFNGIKSKITDKWSQIKSTLGAAKSYLKDTFGPVFTWLRDKVIKPVWDRVGGIIRNAWNKVIKPIFSIMGDVIKGDLPGAFRKGRDLIKSIWDGIKNIAKKPIKFVIDTVLNKGLIGAFNKVAGWIPGVDKLKDVKIPGFATGGYTGPGSKYQEAGIVHADEFVIRKESQQSLRREAPGLLDNLNRYGAKALGYANGGFVRPVRGGRYTGNFGDNRGGLPHAGQDIATPVGTNVYSPLDGVVTRAGWNVVSGRSGIGMLVQHANGISTYAGHLSRSIAKVGQQVKAGQHIAESGNTGRSTGPHLHGEVWINGQPVNPRKFYDGAAQPMGSEGGGLDFLKPILDLGGKIKGWFTDQFPGSSKLGDIAVGTGSKIVGDVKNWIVGKAQAVGDWVSDKWEGAKDGASRLASKAQVRSVAATRLWGAGKQWDALDALINKESSWDIHAANPRTSARGLFQKMTSIHGPIEKTATGQALWGLKYIKERYGNPVNAWDFHKGHNYYADGGRVVPQLHDNGGWLQPGTTLVQNKTGKPEAILNPTDWNTAAQAIDHVVSGEGTGRKNITVTIDGRQFAAYMDERLTNHVTGLRQTRRQVNGN